MMTHSQIQYEMDKVFLEKCPRCKGNVGVKVTRETSFFQYDGKEEVEKWSQIRFKISVICPHCDMETSFNPGRLFTEDAGITDEELIKKYAYAVLCWNKLPRQGDEIE